MLGVKPKVLRVQGEHLATLAQAGHPPASSAPGLGRAGSGFLVFILSSVRSGIKRRAEPALPGSLLAPLVRIKLDAILEESRSSFSPLACRTSKVPDLDVCPCCRLSWAAGRGAPGEVWSPLQPLYEGWFLALFNLMYSTLPVLYIGLFEQVSARQGLVSCLFTQQATCSFQSSVSWGSREGASGWRGSGTLRTRPSIQPSV